jgi:hypothetical protein
VFDLTQELRATLKSAPPPAKKPKAALDSANDPEVAPEAAGDYAAKDISLKAVAVLQQWVETDDLDPGETLADRLMLMTIGIADENKDGEIDDAEQAVVDVALETMWDYLSSKGVSDEDCGLLLNDWDPDAAERIRDLLAENLPDGEDAALADMDNFVFGEEATEPAMDSAVYRRVLAIRGGKKVRVGKRMSGTVRLSAKQKVAIRKAQIKSHSSQAQVRRMRSMHLRRKFGMR